MKSDNTQNDKTRDDIAVLTELNQRIGFLESQNDWKELGDILAPALAFRRAKGKVDTRQDFLDKVKADVDEGKVGIPRETRVDSLSFYGERAVVTCVVTMASASGTPEVYHNVRLFVRQKNQHDEMEWKLLGMGK